MQGGRGRRGGGGTAQPTTSPPCWTAAAHLVDRVDVGASRQQALADGLVATGGRVVKRRVLGTVGNIDLRVEAEQQFHNVGVTWQKGGMRGSKWGSGDGEEID